MDSRSTISDAIGIERQRFAEATRSGDAATARRALGSAHILSQPMLGRHMRVHWLMLCLARRLRDSREIVVQAVRLVLAPIRTLAGHISVGNTGRSNINAFAPMPIPDDLQPLLKNMAMNHDNADVIR